MEKKRYLITGAGGTIGLALLDKLIKKKNVIVCAFDSDEEKLFNISQKYPKSKKINLFLGNIRDKERLLIAMDKIDIVFHCAALKHVSLNEYNPFEVKKTNIDGVENVIETSIQKKIKKVIFTSSDKAVNPTNIMGVAKMMGEHLLLSSNNRMGKNPTKFSGVRFGNVLDSSGSILQIFRKQILNKQPLTVTDKRMTRFFINIDAAVDLCLYAEKNMLGGEIYIKNMASINITDLAIVFSKNSKPSIKYIGMKIGEKLHESLLTYEEANRAYMRNGYIIVVPQSLSISLYTKQKTKIKNMIRGGIKVNKELCSDDNLLSLKSIKKILNSYNVKKTTTQL
jgi:UDP-N-acetylglucosamine 4,6-dehydratase/5-epimerase